MTILAETADHLVEFDQAPTPMLTIADKATGMVKAMTGQGIAGQFRDCLKTHAPERVIQTFLRLAPWPWEPMYKPGALLNREPI